MKILSDCRGSGELRIAVATFEIYGDEGAEGNDGVAEEDKKANDEGPLEQCLIFLGKNFNIGSQISWFPLTASSYVDCRFHKREQPDNWRQMWTNLENTKL